MRGRRLQGTKGMYREFPGAAGRPTPAPPSSNEQGVGARPSEPLSRSANERSSPIVFPSVPDPSPPGYRGAQRSVGAASPLSQAHESHAVILLEGAVRSTVARCRGEGQRVR